MNYNEMPIYYSVVNRTKKTMVFIKSLNDLGFIRKDLMNKNDIFIRVPFQDKFVCVPYLTSLPNGTIILENDYNMRRYKTNRESIGQYKYEWKD